MISVDVVGNRIHLPCPTYNEEVRFGSRNIPGSNWSKRAMAWTFPLSVESCLLLRETFGPRLQIGHDLAAWFRAERGERETMGALAGAKNAELYRVPAVAPALYKAMLERPYQPVAARFIADGKRVLIADHPGLGKTLEAIAGIVESGEPGPYLVAVCPKIAAKQGWGREIPRWLSGQKAINLPEGRAARDVILDRLGEEELASTWLIVHPEILNTKSFWICSECKEETSWTKKPKPVLDCGHNRDNPRVRHEHNFPQVFGIEWGAVIVDESDEMLIARSGDPTQRRRGLELLNIRESGLAVAMSGTPWGEKPFQLWGTLNWLHPKKYSGKWRWIEQYWKLGGYSGYEIGPLIKEREPMLWDSLKDVVLRRTKAEVAQDMPPKTYIGTPYDPSDFDSPVGIWIDMEPAQAKAYNQILKSSAAELENGRLEAVGVLAELTRLQQFASSSGLLDERGEFMPNLPSNKFEWLQEMLRQLGIPKDPQGKVVVVSKFTKLLTMFSFGLPEAQRGMSAMLTGAVSEKRRRDALDRFEMEPGTDSPHVLFLNTAAGGRALTIDSADDMVMLDRSGSAVMQQVEDRIHRVSKPRPVRYHYLGSVGTVDVGQAIVNARRSEDSDRLLDGRRGIEYFRQVLEASHV